MDAKILMMILMTIGGMVVGYQYAIETKDCQQDYNRGYGDALYYTIEHQRMDMNHIWVNKSSIPANGFYNMTYYNYTSFNMTPNMTMGLTGCYENETGYNPSDLVMHLTCKS